MSRGLAEARRWSPVEILDLRHFSSVDLRPLLDDETQVWSRLLSWDYTSSSDMILRYVDAKILPGYAAIDRGRIFGYAFFVYEGSKGVIGDLFVTNGQRLPEAREVESRLLAHVIETLQQSPGIHRVEAQLLVHEAGVLARPFLDQGFRRHPRLFMAMPLNPQSRPAPSVLPEYRSRGVGEALLACTANALRKRSFSLLSLTVTEANSRAVELYKRLGFDAQRVFDAFVWEER